MKTGDRISRELSELCVEENCRPLEMTKPEIIHQIPVFSLNWIISV